MMKRSDEQAGTDVNDRERHQTKKTAYEREIIEIQADTSSESEDEGQQDTGKFGIETKKRVSEPTVEQARRGEIEIIVIEDETERSEDEEITAVRNDVEPAGGATGERKKERMNGTFDQWRHPSQHMEMEMMESDVGTPNDLRLSQESTAEKSSQNEVSGSGAMALNKEMGDTLETDDLEDNEKPGWGGEDGEENDENKKQDNTPRKMKTAEGRTRIEQGGVMEETTGEKRKSRTRQWRLMVSNSNNINNSMMSPRCVTITPVLENSEHIEPETNEAKETTKRGESEGEAGWQELNEENRAARGHIESASGTTERENELLSNRREYPIQCAETQATEANGRIPDNAKPSPEIESSLDGDKLQEILAETNDGRENTTIGKLQDQNDRINQSYAEQAKDGRSESGATTRSKKMTESKIKGTSNDLEPDSGDIEEGRFEDAEEACRRTKGGTPGEETCQDFIRGECRQSRCKFKHPSRKERTEEEVREIEKNAESGREQMARRRRFAAKNSKGQEPSTELGRKGGEEIGTDEGKYHRARHRQPEMNPNTVNRGRLEGKRSDGMG